MASDHNHDAITQATVKRLRDFEYRFDRPDLFACKETLLCVRAGCVPCAYKIVVTAKKDSVPNQRPENCLRYNSEQALASYKARGRVGLYTRGMSVLLVGDGDFSYSHALARVLMLGPKSKRSRIVASSYESEESVVATYPKVEATIKDLRKMGVQVLHGVNAADLSSTSQIASKKFDRIIWNFPCVRMPDGADGQNNEMDVNRVLVRDFLFNAADFLSPGGEVHITHKTKPPFDKWDISSLAAPSAGELSSAGLEPEAIAAAGVEAKGNSGDKKKSGLVFHGSVVFDRSLYPGYTNRKALDRKSFPIWDSETFVFGEEDVPKKSSGSTLPGQLPATGKDDAQRQWTLSSSFDVEETEGWGMAASIRLDQQALSSVHLLLRKRSASATINVPLPSQMGKTGAGAAAIGVRARLLEAEGGGQGNAKDRTQEEGAGNKGSGGRMAAFQALMGTTDSSEEDEDDEGGEEGVARDEVEEKRVGSDKQQSQVQGAASTRTNDKKRKRSLKHQSPPEGGNKASKKNTKKTKKRK